MGEVRIDSGRLVSEPRRKVGATPVRLAHLIALVLGGFLCLSAFADFGGSAPPDFVPHLSLSYMDPQSGERVSCADSCRRLSVPAGVELEVRVRVENTSGDPWPDGVPWDLWFDQPIHPLPGIDIGVCRDGKGGPVDLECWKSLADRVDWDSWDGREADRVCVPENPDACRDVTIAVQMDPDFDGSRGRGVYSFAAWVDRFRSAAESDEFNNFAGPIRVKVQTPGAMETAGGPTATDDGGPEAVVASSSPMPYSILIRPGHAETGFSLSSPRSRAALEFLPAYNGKVAVEVDVTEAPEKIVVEVRKVSTGAVVAEAGGRMRVQLEGAVGGVDLKDDRRFEFVVRLDQGSRGSRGTIKVSYPARAMYRRVEPE